MSVKDALSRLKQVSPDVAIAAFVDLEACMVLASSGGPAHQREYLDDMAADAVALLGSDKPFALRARPGMTRLYLRAPQGSEALLFEMSGAAPIVELREKASTFWQEDADG